MILDRYHRGEICPGACLVAGHRLHTSMPKLNLIHPKYAWNILAFARLGAQGAFLFGLLCAVLLGVAFIGGWLVQTTLHEQETQIPPPGRMVHAAGEWVHIQCRGPKDAPTVVLEAGVMGWSSVWAWMFQHVPPNRRVCAWDRPGLGWSLPSRRPADAASSAVVLRAALAEQDVKMPMVLVGHSLGGLYSLVYENMYPDDVAALVLVDPAHPQQLSRLPQTAVNRTFTQVDRIETTLPLLDFGVARWLLEWRSSSSLFKLPVDTRSNIIHISASRAHLARSVQEYQAWGLSSLQAQQSGPHISTIPLIVLSSADREMGNRPANEMWWTLHQSLASLSTQGHWSVVPNTSHQSIIMDESAALLLWEHIQAVVPDDTKTAAP